MPDFATFVTGPEAVNLEAVINAPESQLCLLLQLSSGGQTFTYQPGGMAARVRLCWRSMALNWKPSLGGPQK